MIRLVLLATLLAGCRISLESADLGGDGTSTMCKVDMTSQLCMDATTHSDFAWLEANVFTRSCIFSGCHNGSSSPAGKVDLRAGMSFSHLVNFTSVLAPPRKLVVPNDVEASYLMLMLTAVPPEMASPPGEPPPASVYYMPQTFPFTPLCCQKLDAIERWINAGAPNN